MSAIRKEGKINQNTTLIDIGMFGIHGAGAVYLIESDKKCLIDAGTRKEAPHLVSALRRLNSFPPDLIILTHPHWDHTQGVPLLRKEAQRQGKKIEILASKEAIPLLADSSFNDVYGGGPYESIENVTPVKEGDEVDLGGLKLLIYDVPGHCKGHIAVFDSKNKNLFVGDSLGNKMSDKMFLAPFTPPRWDRDDFLASVNKMKQIPYETLCLAHFGCITGTEAKSILDESVATCNFWWQFYEKNASRLEDTAFLAQEIQKAINPKADIKPTSAWKMALIRMTSALGMESSRRVLIFRDHLRWLAKGYSMYKGAHPGS